MHLVPRRRQMMHVASVEDAKAHRTFLRLQEVPGGLEGGRPEPLARLWRGDSYTVSLTSNSITQQSQYVDYLSHSWKEEDIWLSRKHVAWSRKAYSDGARLENAS